MDKLKPCPFCGGSANIAVMKKTVRSRYTVSCANSFCIANALSSPFATHYLTEKEAIEAWNRRKKRCVN